MTHRRRRGPTLLLLTLLLTPGTALLADRLHLSSGGHVDVGRWWTEGDWIYYEGPGGVVGLPRSVVVRVDEDGSSSGSAPSKLGSYTAKTAPRSTAVGPDKEKSRRRSAAPNSLLEPGYDALRKRDFDAASRIFWDVLQDDAGIVGAQVGYALSEIALERDGMALSVVLDGLVQRPEQPDLLELLGDLRNRQENVEEALRQWRKAVELGPSERLREKIAKAEREIAAGRDYDFATTSHFNMRYDGDVDQALAGDVVDYLESQYQELSSTFRYGPPQPITVLLYPTREFREVTQAPEWVGGLYDGKIRVPLAGLNRLTPAAEAVLRHELAHAFIHSKTRGQCPRWLHEGLAQIVEGRTLGRGQRSKLIQSFSASDNGGDPATAFSYPAALGLTRFLERRRGLHGVVWVLDLLGQGTALDEALRQTYGLEYGSLVQRWKEELREGR